ncbi:Uncharacterised protein [Mycobacteroides abscessus subsp. abscessus]|nr:Uncharacterised protein [Mycobacteroides abscessus subsp. abscessus]
MIITVTAATAPITNGTRQPHESIWAGVRICSRMIWMPSAQSWPSTIETYWKLEKKPRRPGVATSER